MLHLTSIRGGSRSCCCPMLLVDYLQKGMLDKNENKQFKNMHHRRISQTILIKKKAQT